MGIFNRKIISTEIIDSYTDSKKSAGSSLVRGAVGGALLGPAGLLAGGLSGKNKNTQMTTFLIKYDDGSQETQIIKNKGLLYDTYIKFLKEENSSNSKYDELNKLKELLDKNIITKEEFEKEKQKILN